MTLVVDQHEQSQPLQHCGIDVRRSVNYQYDQPCFTGTKRKEEEDGFVCLFLEAARGSGAAWPNLMYITVYLVK